MNKKIILFPIALVSLLSISVLSTIGTNLIKADETIYHVDFYDNYLRQEFVLSSGYKGIGNNLLYKTIDVTANSLVSKPEDPSRKYYDFAGWFKEKECQNEWDFEKDVVTSNTRLFAYWTFIEPEEIIEPEYNAPSTVLSEDEDHDFELYSVMNFSVNTSTSPHTLELPTSALSRLSLANQADLAAEEGKKTNVLSLLEYKAKASKSLTATYATASSTLTITCGEEVENIKISAKSYDPLSNTNYETKAKKYEAKVSSEENENYHVMLAGSSSIEYWENSKSDLDPIVSYNHGIGGTTIEQWTTQLNDRLVYPYKPKLVVYYVGINNVINSGETATAISNKLTTFFDSVHSTMPNTKVIYILMNLLPGYSSYTSTINSVNQKAREYKTSNSADWLVLVNPGEALLKENNQPSAAYFRTDGLHLSNYGYTIWGGIIKEAILETLESM